MAGTVCLSFNYSLHCPKCIFDELFMLRPNVFQCLYVNKIGPCTCLCSPLYATLHSIYSQCLQSPNTSVFTYHFGIKCFQAHVKSSCGSQAGMLSWTGRTCCQGGRSRGWAWLACSTTSEEKRHCCCLSLDCGRFNFIHSTYGTRV